MERTSHTAGGVKCCMLFKTPLIFIDDTSEWVLLDESVVVSVVIMDVNFYMQSPHRMTCVVIAQGVYRIRNSHQ